VAGGIYGGDGDDTVIMKSGPDSVSVVIDGGSGTDKIVFGGGAWSPGDAKLTNFESFSLDATADLTLNGDWDVSGDTVPVNGGSLIVNGELKAGGLAINSGTATINGSADLGGDVTNSGSLGVSPGGTLSAVNFSNSGLATIDGTANFSGTSSNSGILNVNSSNTLNTAALDNSGTTTINGSATVSGAANNTGTLSVASGGTLKAGSLSNSGAASISGSADISGAASNSGSLNVNGSLSTAGLTNSGTLSGSGMIHGNIVNHGIISPGNSIGTLSVSGSVTFEPGSALMSELSRTQSCDLLSVAGAVNINGGTVHAFLPRGLYEDGHSWEVIKATGGVTGTFASISGQPDSAVLRLEQVNRGDTLNLVIDRTSYGSFASGGAADTGRGLDSLVPLADGDMRNLLLAMDWDMDGTGIAAVLNAVNPEMYTAFSTASLAAGALFDGALARRLEDLRQRRALTPEQERAESGPVRLAAAEAMPLGGISAPSSGRGWSLWGRGLGLWANQKAADGYLGFSQSAGGAAVGADGMISHWLRLGLAAGVSRSDLGFSRAAYSGDIEAVHTGLYLQADLTGGFFARATVSYARLSNDASRAIAFGNLDTRANGNFDGDLFGASLAAGWDVRAGSWLIEPLAGLDYQRLEEDGFSEHGAGYLDIDVAGRDTDSLVSSLGIRATRLIRTGGWELLPRVGLAWRHQLGDDRPELAASFSGYGSAPFTVQGARFPGEAAVMELGLSATLSQSCEFFADYRLGYADDYHAQTLSAGLMLRF